ncbi:MAG: endolytic transglycosylase MltG [Solirubrobacterales bacterium]
MNERPPDDTGSPAPDDPFLAEDPAAAERERRRLEREQRRAHREARQSERDARDAQRAAGREPHERGPSGRSPTERASAALSGLGDRISKRRGERKQPPTPSRPADDVPYAHEIAPGSGGRSFLSRLPGPTPVLIVLAVFALALLLFLNALFQPFHDDGGKKVLFKIKNGESAGSVADRLDEEGIVSSGTLLEIRLTLAGRRGDVFPGAYSLQEDMSYSAAMTELTKPPSQRTIAVTVPEGLSREQIAVVSTDAGLEGSYEKASKSSKELDPAEYGAEGAPSLEGFLFPSTFELKPKSSADDLVAEQLAAFKREFKKVDMKYAQSKDLSAYEVLTIASMIDREVQVPEERKLVSSVIYNRLESGEPLGVDATIRYEDGNYTKPLETARLEQATHYNTYTSQGLPPTPIGNPGLDAIQAAAAPADTEFLFYVVKPGTCGVHEFNETLAEHNAASARYNDAREAAGGKSPTDC